MSRLQGGRNVGGPIDDEIDDLDRIHKQLSPEGSLSLLHLEIFDETDPGVFVDKIERLVNSAMLDYDMGVFSTEQALLHVENLEKKAQLYLENGYIDTFEWNDVAEESREAVAVIKENVKDQKALRETYKGWQQSMFESLQRKSIAAEVYADKLRAQKAETSVRDGRKQAEEAVIEREENRIKNEKAFERFDTQREEIEEEIENATDPLKRQQLEDELEANTQNVEKFKTSFEIESKEERSRWNKIADMLEKRERDLSNISEGIRDFDITGSENAAVKWLEGKGKTAMDKYITSTRDAIKGMTKAGDIMFDGYRKYAKSFIESGGDVAEFYDKAKSVSKHLSKQNIETLANEMQTLVDMKEAGASYETLLRQATRFNTPSARMWMRSMDEFRELREIEGIEWLLNGLAVIIKLLVRAPMLITLKTLESFTWMIAGDDGLRAMTAVGEVVGTSVLFMHSFMETAFGPEVQGLILFIQLEIDATKSAWGSRMGLTLAGLFPGSGLLLPLDTLRLNTYPDETKQAKGQIEVNDMINSEAMDHEELKFSLDFWGKAYHQVMELSKKGYKDYVPFTEFKAIRRWSGKYINLKSHPLDGDERVAQCQHLEKQMDLNTLVDDNGALATADKGARMIGRAYPRRDQSKWVRNLADFPLYKNTIYWPTDGGQETQIQGKFLQKNIDPAIAALFIQWATDGTFGVSYNTSTSAETRHLARVANQRDLDYFLHPSKRGNDWPTAMLDLDKWVSGNRGAQKMMSQLMWEVGLKDFDQERKLVIDPKTVPWYVPALDPGMTNMETLDHVREMTRTLGRYPLDVHAWNVYANATKSKSPFIQYYRRIINPFPGPFNPAPFNLLLTKRKPTPGEKREFTDVIKAANEYRAALVKTDGDAKSAMDTVMHDVMWRLYMDDTAAERTIWGYINQFKGEFIQELQGATLVYAGNQKRKLIQDFMKAVVGKDIPLNTDSIHRAAFIGNFANLAYDPVPDSAGDVRKKLEKITGPWTHSELITTGLTTSEKISWAASLFEDNGITMLTKGDFPVTWGNLHCKIIAFDKPQPMVVVAFRGTTTGLEWAVDGDFSSAHFGSIVPDKHGNGFTMEEVGFGIPIPENVMRIFSKPGLYTVHRGFARAWAMFRDDIKTRVQELVDTLGIQYIMVTGHSLGAGIAQLCAMEMPHIPLPAKDGAEVSNRKPNVYTFSSPNVGDSRFGTEFGVQVGEHIHTFIDGDIVTIAPPFLLPDHEEGKLIVDILAWEFKGSLSDMSTLMANMVGFIQFILGESVLDIPSVFQPMSWLNDLGQFDKTKALANFVDVYVAFNQNRAVKGDGVHFRLGGVGSTDYLEQPYDMGVSMSAMQLLMDSVTRTEMVVERHNMENVVSTMQAVADANPDLFESLEDNPLPKWPPHNIPNPGGGGKVNPVPADVLPLLQKGTVIGFAHTKRKYKPYQLVDHDDVDEFETVLIPFHLDQLKTQADIQLHKKRSKLEHSDHTYL